MYVLMKKKSIFILCFMVVIAILLNVVAFFGFNVAGFKYGGMFDEQKGIRKGIDLAGGSVITLQAQADNPSDSDMDVVEAIFNTRLDNAGYTEKRISKSEGGKITVEIPSVFETDEIAKLLGAMAQLKFVDADGKEIFSGTKEFVSDASYEYGATQSGGNSSHHVKLSFTQAGKQKFAEATRAAVAQTSQNKNYISIVMDDQPISSPRVSEEINSDSCVITGDFTAESAKQLANQIKSGQLPFNLTVISQETVGAELGANALPTALMAAAIGILLIMIFMVIMYRVPGLIADLSLLIYVGLIGLAMGLLRMNLSLSGIAGIVLSIGMAVDADCIIFERMKEELNAGKSIRAAVEAGFDKAFSAILDSNVTTIITCVVLYISGIGTVTGFATTLGVGVVLSMFTAIVITKFLLKQLVNIGIKNRSLMARPMKKKGGEQ